MLLAFAVVIKNKLKKHKNIDQLPKADFYFTAVILPKSSKDKTINIYGYFNVLKNCKISSSKKFEEDKELFELINR